MKTFETITKWIIVLSIALTVAVVSASDNPTASKFSTTNHFITASYISHTNYVRTTSVTNIVIKSDNWIAVTDMDVAGITMRIPVTEQGRTNIINTLVESGEFCRVRGHAWGVTDKIGCRECKVCGAHQTPYASEWK